jgi:hypothetical protein
MLIGQTSMPTDSCQSFAAHTATYWCELTETTSITDSVDRDKTGAHLVGLHASNVVNVYGIPLWQRPHEAVRGEVHVIINLGDPFCIPPLAYLDEERESLVG